MKNKIICWWSGGITSAVACFMAINIFGKENCRVIFIDTKNEDKDTYRFMKDCEKWYGITIETITNEKYSTIQEVWRSFKSLNVSFGAICSSELKREVRKEWQRNNNYKYQVFGFDIDEPKRAKGMTTNYPKAKAIYPLLMFGTTKKECIKIVEEQNIEVPMMYKLGFHNNNCFSTGCVQGGIGYWQKMQKDFPKKFEAMANMEHELTDKKGVPVTMLKDQSKNGGLLFLKPLKDYPEIKDISMKKGREVKPLLECNGFCGVNDLEVRNETEKEINFADNQIDMF
jgi:3'-phosphoadenosine 5'-phosphosulfate sulfotransferase (PAPS reductase)/FAD synthetase